MVSEKIKVSIFTTKWGHYSIGKAIENTLSKNGEYLPIFNNVKLDKLSENSNLFFYRLFPSLFKLPFKAAEMKEMAKLLESYFKRNYGHKIEKLIVEQKPDVVLNAYFGFNWILEKLAKKFNFLYLNAVADPKSVNKVTVSKDAYNLVFDESTKNKCLSFGISADKILITGWFVRESFNKVYSKAKAKEKLNIPNGTFVIVVVGGSAGNFGVLKSLPAFVSPKKPMQVFFVCGESKVLLKSIKNITKIFSFKNLKLIPLGFRKDLYNYLQAADLVIGKAGPNLLFETAATKTPFFAISHISGQEDGNLEIIKNYNIGVVEENQIKSTKLLRSIIKNPKKLDRYKKSLEQMSEYNKNSGEILDKFIKSHLQTT